MNHQSLYRRFRPKRFDEVLGQDHVTKALRNAVRDGRVGHAYLFSGPRGTGKTSAARILAKVLNCANPQDGEPCCVCDNCLAVQRGQVTDWFLEQDAASKSKVDDMRDLLDRVPLGTSGNRKVIILDEVHMLSQGAENALLKTLEEPPDHVIFILATTDPQKVRPTIRSRTQHFSFNLLPPDILDPHIRHVIDEAGLPLGDDAVAHVLRAGGGSARDTLSALDQVAALGEVVTDTAPVDAILDALAARDAGAILVAVAQATATGREPRTLGEAIIARLRDAFLAVLGVGDEQLPADDRAQAKALGEAIGTAGLTRALEVLGEALMELSRKPDPRIVVEVALIRLTRPDADRSIDAILQRLEHLEQAVRSGGGSAAPATAPAPSPTAEPAAQPRAPAPQQAAPAAPTGPAAQPAPAPAPPPSRSAPEASGAGGPASAARAALAETLKSKAQGGRSASPAPAPAATPAPAPSAAASPEPTPAATPSPAAPSANAAPTATATTSPPTTDASAPDQTAAPSPAPTPASTGPAPTGAASSAATDASAAPGPTAAAGSASTSAGAAPASTAAASPATTTASPDPGPAAAASPAPEPAPASGDGGGATTNGGGGGVDLAGLTKVWSEVLGELPLPVRSKWRGGNWVMPIGNPAQFAVPNAWHKQACDEGRRDVEQALVARLGPGLTVAVVVDGESSDAGPAAAAAAPTQSTPSDDEQYESVDVSELRDASDAATGGVDLLLREFGGELLEEDP